MVIALEHTGQSALESAHNKSCIVSLIVTRTQFYLCSKKKHNQCPLMLYALEILLVMEHESIVRIIIV